LREVCTGITIILGVPRRQTVIQAHNVLQRQTGQTHVVPESVEFEAAVALARADSTQS